METDAGKDDNWSHTDKETANNKCNFDNDGTPIDWIEMEIDPSTALPPQPESFNGWSNKTGYVYDVRMKYVSDPCLPLVICHQLIRPFDREHQGVLHDLDSISMQIFAFGPNLKTHPPLATNALNTILR
jgi:hypothetical protein